jgi:hypothetical protein
MQGFVHGDIPRWDFMPVAWVQDIRPPWMAEVSVLSGTLADRPPWMAEVSVLQEQFIDPYFAYMDVGT